MFTVLLFKCYFFSLTFKKLKRAHTLEITLQAQNKSLYIDRKIFNIALLTFSPGIQLGPRAKMSITLLSRAVKWLTPLFTAVHLSLSSKTSDFFLQLVVQRRQDDVKEDNSKFQTRKRLLHNEAGV